MRLTLLRLTLPMINDQINPPLAGAQRKASELGVALLPPNPMSHHPQGTLGYVI